jgi:hypothetical protein
MNLLIFYIILIPIICIIITDYIIYVDLNIHYTKNKYKWCTFKVFKEKFLKYNNWKIDSSKYYFLNNDDYNYNDYHIIESIIVINNENIVLYPIDYILFKFYCIKVWNKMNKNYLTRRIEL